MGTYDESTRSIVNPDERLVVGAIEADDCGGISLSLSGGFRLVLFPEGSSGEDWRLLRPNRDGVHLVIEGGKVVED